MKTISKSVNIDTAVNAMRPLGLVPRTAGSAEANVLLADIGQAARKPASIRFTALPEMGRQFNRLAPLAQSLLNHCQELLAN